MDAMLHAGKAQGARWGTGEVNACLADCIQGAETPVGPCTLPMCNIPAAIAPYAGMHNLWPLVQYNGN